MPSEDITFCANKGCSDMNCFRNPKHIRLIDIPHSFALFTQCSKWRDKNTKWLASQINNIKEEN